MPFVGFDRFCGLLSVSLCLALLGGNARAGSIDQFVQITGSSLRTKPLVKAVVDEHGQVATVEFDQIIDGGSVEKAFFVDDTSPSVMIFDVTPPSLYFADFFALTFTNNTGQDLSQIDITLGVQPAGEAFSEEPAANLVMFLPPATSNLVTTFSQPTPNHMRFTTDPSTVWQADTDFSVGLTFGLTLPDMGRVARRDGLPGYELALQFDTTPVSVPEPTSLMLIVVGMGLVTRRSRRIQ